MNILSQNIYVWGTGVCALIFVSELKQYDAFMIRWRGDKLGELIRGFIDNDKEKHGNIYEGKHVYSPEILLQDKEITCVLALSDADVIEQIKKDYKHIRFLSYVEYLDEIVQELCDERANIYIDLLGVNMPRLKNSHNDLTHYLQQMRGIIEKSALHDVEMMLYNLLMHEYIDANNERTLREILAELSSSFSTAEIIGFLKWQYGVNIQRLADALKDLEENKYNKNSCTLGICIDRYWSGGIERVVSLLVDEYVKHGHRVVLFLNERNKEKDWNIPDQVKCHVMRYSIDKDFCLRMNELGKYISEYSIDIMCIHSGYNKTSTFYEMLFIRMLKVPVILELHSSYPALVRKDKRRAELLGNMYRVASRVIVLSQSDKEYWSGKGCSCIYIQNPISGIIDVHMDIQEPRNQEIILWVGRLVQNPKNVLDVVPIMKAVIKTHPGAKLKLLGSKERDYDYNLLRESIVKENLGDNIELCGYHKDVSSFYKEASVFLFTSSYESFSQVIFESKQWGLPMVMYEIPWLELTRSQEGYISVPQRDVEAAANAITKLLDDDLYRREIGKSAKASVKRFLEYDVYSAWQNTFNEFSVNNMMSSKE